MPEEPPFPVAGRMKKRYSVLQKKLLALESLLLSHPRNTPPDNARSREIDRRFRFLQKLLAAEMESHPDRSRYLSDAALRLNELQEIYRGTWDGCDEEETWEQAEDAGDQAPPEVEGEGEGCPGCSCMESCVNEEKDGLLMDGPEEAKGKPSKGWTRGLRPSLVVAAAVMGLAVMGLVIKLSRGSTALFLDDNGFLLLPT